MEVTSKGDCDGDSVPNDVEVEIDSTDDRDPCDYNVANLVINNTSAA